MARETVFLLIGFIAGLILFGTYFYARRNRDPYDLESLNRSVEDNIYEHGYLPDVPADASGYCPKCDLHYDSYFHRCPKCGG